MKIDTPRIRSDQEFTIDIDAPAALIAATQLASGEIPWSPGQKTDPWDHVEAAMGLCVAGYYQEARKAYRWLKQMQLEDGSWYASYMQGVPDDQTRDVNMSTYVAVGMFHYYLVTGDLDFLKEMWSTVAAGIHFALKLQQPEGVIYWAISPEGVIDPMALLTGSSSTYMSLKCALAISEKLGHRMPAWRESLRNLGDAIRSKPHLFNMTKSRFSMDWFYPVLSGALTGDDAYKRIDRYWKKFIVQDRGVRCVSDEPWVTIAETSELALALRAMGNPELSRIVFNWICDRRFEDGSYWCGFTCPDMTIWPEEKITWTNAVALMAADAIYNLTPAAQIFNHDFWKAYDFV